MKFVRKSVTLTVQYAGVRGPLPAANYTGRRKDDVSGEHAVLEEEVWPRVHNSLGTTHSRGTARHDPSAQG